MEATEVSRGAFALFGKSDSMADGWGSNQGFVVTSEGVVVIDTGFTAARAKELLAAIRDVTDAPLRLVVNTHDHSDHVFGNSVLLPENPVIISHQKCRSRLVRLGTKRISGYRKIDKVRHFFDGLDISPPHLTYDEGLSFKLGGTEFRLVHPRHAHTTGDTMVYLPREKTLFAGDVLWSGYHPNMEDGDVEGWVAALKGISRMHPRSIHPGHGQLAHRGALRALEEYLLWFDAALWDAAAKRVTPEAAARRLMPPGAERWELTMIIRRNAEILLPRYRAALRTKVAQTR